MSPKHWYDKAEETRAIAGQMKDDARKLLLKIADQYDGIGRTTRDLDERPVVRHPTIRRKMY